MVLEASGGLLMSWVLEDGAQNTVESAALFMQQVQKLLKHSCNEAIL